MAQYRGLTFGVKMFCLSLSARMHVFTECGTQACLNLTMSIHRMADSFACTTAMFDAACSSPSTLGLLINKPPCFHSRCLTNLQFRGSSRERTTTLVSQVLQLSALLLAMLWSETEGAWQGQVHGEDVRWHSQRSLCCRRSRRWGHALASRRGYRDR
jgi:hypothetical protein